jgi:SAM-dependent methyltransferase
LNFLFYLWKEAIGYVLHPAIPVPEEGWKVADVATGTGLWLCELAKNAPEATSFDGFDISSDQFPHPHSLPDNVTLGVLDATKPPPLDLCGKYDVVHVRLLISVVDNDDPGPVISHCLNLLSEYNILTAPTFVLISHTEPGGYLQWDELDCAASQRLLQSTESPSPYLSALNKIFSTTKPTG